MKGHISIPEQVRTAHQWQAGQELELIEMGSGILLRPKITLPTTEISDVAGCLAYSGEAKTVAEMEKAIADGV